MLSDTLIYCNVIATIAQLTPPSCHIVTISLSWWELLRSSLLATSPPWSQVVREAWTSHTLHGEYSQQYRDIKIKYTVKKNPSYFRQLLLGHLKEENYQYNEFASLSQAFLGCNEQSLSTLSGLVFSTTGKMASTHGPTEISLAEISTDHHLGKSNAPISVHILANSVFLDGLWFFTYSAASHFTFSHVVFPSGMSHTHGHAHTTPLASPLANSCSFTLKFQHLCYFCLKVIPSLYCLPYHTYDGNIAFITQSGHYMSVSLSLPLWRSLL